MRDFIEIKKQALQHMNDGTLELGPEITTNLVSTYRDNDLFIKELKRCVHTRPLPIVPSQQIPIAGDTIAKTLAGIAVIIARQNDGNVRAFINSCRHRGASLTKEGSTSNCGKIICPFHGWNYALDGSLIETPGAGTSLTSTGKNSFKLKELRCVELLGMIWIVLDPQVNGDITSSQFQLLIEDLPQLGFTPKVALPSLSFTANFNWKLGLEAFLEVYHFTHSHAPHLSDLQFPNLSLSDTDQGIARIVVPLMRPTIEQKILEWAQVMYFIFPATFILFYNDHVAMISLVPESVNTTSFRYIPIAADQTTIDSGQVLKKVDLLKKIVAQDIVILEGIQKNLNSGGNQRFTFTRLEPMIDWFHRSLQSTID